MPHRTLHEVLSPLPPVSMSPLATVRDAARAMSERHVGSVLVEEGGSLCGIFTERDVLDRVISPGLDPERVHLSQVMTADPATVCATATITQALHVMREGKLRHLPVTGPDGTILGIVSMRDFVSEDIRECDHEIEMQEILFERIG